MSVQKNNNKIPQSKDDSWMGGEPNIEVVVDNQAATNLLSRRACLESVQHKLKLQSAIDLIESLLCSGWIARYRTLPLIR